MDLTATSLNSHTENFSLSFSLFYEIERKGAIFSIALWSVLAESFAFCVCLCRVVGPLVLVVQHKHSKRASLLKQTHVAIHNKTDASTINKHIQPFPSTQAPVGLSPGPSGRFQNCSFGLGKGEDRGAEGRKEREEDGSFALCVFLEESFITKRGAMGGGGFYPANASQGLEG